jgi:hypothetical protein
MTYNMYCVTQTKKYPAWLSSVLALMLLGGTVASQTWCWKLSKRLFYPYRPAYGTQHIASSGEHIDSYTPAPSCNGTDCSSGTTSSSNGATVGGSSGFQIGDKDSAAVARACKKVL